MAAFLYRDPTIDRALWVTGLGDLIYLTDAYAREGILPHSAMPERAELAEEAVRPAGFGVTHRGQNLVGVPPPTFGERRPFVSKGPHRFFVSFPISRERCP